MLFLCYLVFIYFAFTFRRKASPAIFLFFIYISSLIGAVAIGYDYKIDTEEKIWNFIFLALILAFFILPWNCLPYSVKIMMPDRQRLRTLTLVLLSINIIIFIVFSISIFYSFSSIVDYSAFKNGGESGDFIKALPINNTLYLLALYLHPTAYFLMPLHFYYLMTGNKKMSYLCLLFSLNVVLHGLTIFSRSGFIIFVFLYGAYLPFFYNKCSRKTKNTIKLSLGLLAASALTVFFFVTANRFENEIGYNDILDSNVYITNPIIFSLFDYGCQWYRNGSIVINSYQFESLNGQLSFPFPILIADKLGLVNYPIGEIETRLYVFWGAYYDRFNGITANILFDFGYVGTFIFAAIYSSFVLWLRPGKNGLPLAKLMAVAALFLLPAMGIFNYEMKTVYYNLLIVYTFLICGYLNGFGHKKILK
ncbi:O-antigen polymerase [Janthinobacterium sp. BJB304]|uniref:O-antigen polymerase n=1 Tax=Janthinobacterium sp. BJB304 TaxID=1572871 RepID=UPI000C10457C|nr:O-antigen polymerase [Janthinobacterium sp. BJB304]PHV38905.1 hypothetical protein CSQ95_11595 [Janthinobacterium sp. BJB304]